LGHHLRLKPKFTKITIAATPMYKIEKVATIMKKLKACIPKIKQIHCVLRIGSNCRAACFLVTKLRCFMIVFEL
jgi:hypothetical protein